MTWNAGSSVGERVGEEARASHHDQRALAMKTLSRSEGSLLVFTEETDQMRVVASFFVSDSSEEEHEQHKRAFLVNARDAIDDLLKRYSL